MIAPAREPVPFHIESRQEAGVRLIAVSGELDISTAPQLAAALNEAMDGHDAVLTDLCAVDFIDSTGVRFLWEGHHRITQQGRRFAVSCLDGAAPDQIIALTGLHSLIERYHDRVSGLAALRGCDRASAATG